MTVTTLLPVSLTDLLSEDSIGLSEASKIFPGAPSTGTIWRWWKVGVRGVHLETFAVGGKRFTTKQAVRRFIEASTERANDGTKQAGGRKRRKG